MRTAQNIIINLRLLVFQKDVTLSEISRDTGISRTTLTTLYRQRSKAISLEVLEKLCVYFNCDINDLIKLKSA